MGLSTDIVNSISDRLQDVYQQIEFFQDQIVIIDDAKSTWDNAIYKIENQLMGEIEIVNRAIDDVKDAYDVRFSGVNSCRSDLFWMLTNWNKAPTPNLMTFKAVALNGDGYADVVAEGGGNMVGVDPLTGIGNSWFYYLDPATAGLTSAPTNAKTGAEQSDRGWDENTYRFGFAPKSYYGIKYYDQRYAQDIGDTFVTNFIGSIAPSTSRVIVLQPKDAVGIDTVFEVGQIISCGKTGVWGATTKITGVSTGYTNLSQLPSLTGITTNFSLVNILTVSTSAGLGASLFESVEFRVIDDPDSGPVSGTLGDVTSNGEVYKASQQYWDVPSSSNLGGRGATFSVFTSPSGGIATSGISTTIGGVAVNHVKTGDGYATGEIITIEGGLIGGSTPADNISFTVTPADKGRWQYSLPSGDNPDSVIDPFNPETVGIMQTSTIGIGVSIALDNSGAPRGSQAWDPKNEGWDFSPKLDGSGIVYPPNVGADVSYWKVGFQTAPIFQGNRVSAGDPTGSIASNVLGVLLETLDACDSTVDNPINNAVSSLTTIENSFNDEDGKHKIMIDASNGLRAQRNEAYLRIWGMRQSIGGINEEITNLESVDSYVKNETIEGIIE